MAGTTSVRITYGYIVHGPDDQFIHSSEEVMAALTEGA
jgi:hypothetical protein